MLYFHRNGVSFKIPIAKDAIYDHDLLERQIKVALNDLQQLKDRSPGLEQMRHESPGYHIVSSIFGRDEIIIMPPAIAAGRKEKVVVEEKKRFEDIIPYLRCPDGFLLCLGGLTFDGPYELKNFYDLPYSDGYYDKIAPYIYPVSSPNNIFDGDAPTTPTAGETLLEWQVKDFVDDDSEEEFTYNEPNYYGEVGQYSPGYWKSYPAYYAEREAAWDSGDPLITDHYLFDYNYVVLSNFEGITSTSTLSWGWVFTPAVYTYSTTLISRLSTTAITYNGADIVGPVQQAWTENGAYTIGNMDGDTAEEEWHIAGYYGPGGCPEDPTMFYWESCPSVGPWPYIGLYETWENGLYNYEEIAYLDVISNLADSWAVIYKRKITTSYRAFGYDYASYYSTEPGTQIEPYKFETDYGDTETFFCDVTYVDSFGNSILLDSGLSESEAFNVAGKVRLYEVEDENIFVFGYDRLYNRQDGAPHLVGVARITGANITDLSLGISAGDVEYTWLRGVQHMGILVRDGHVTTEEEIEESEA